MKRKQIGKTYYPKYSSNSIKCKWFKYSKVKDNGLDLKIKIHICVKKSFKFKNSTNRLQVKGWKNMYTPGKQQDNKPNVTNQTKT